MKLATSSNDVPQRGCAPTTTEEWYILNAVLSAYIQRCIYMLNIFYWQGGENLLVEDVLIETYLRAIPCARNAENGTTPPILSFEALCKTIAKRYLLDLRRKDKRIVFSIDATPCFREHQYVEMSDDSADTVIENMLMYSKMLLVSKAIKDFTPKLKKAMLIHLANLTDFDDEQPSPLDQAMREVGISLHDYCCELPRDKVSRSRHASLLSQGYRRLRDILGYQTCPTVIAA